MTIINNVSTNIVAPKHQKGLTDSNICGTKLTRQYDLLHHRQRAKCECLQATTTSCIEIPVAVPVLSKEDVTSPVIEAATTSPDSTQEVNAKRKSVNFSRRKMFR